MDEDDLYDGPWEPPMLCLAELDGCFCRFEIAHEGAHSWAGFVSDDEALSVYKRP